MEQGRLPGQVPTAQNVAGSLGTRSIHEINGAHHHVQHQSQQQQHLQQQQPLQQPQQLASSVQVVPVVQAVATPGIVASIPSTSTMTSPSWSQNLTMNTTPTAVTVMETATPGRSGAVEALRNTSGDKQGMKLTSVTPGAGVGVPATTTGLDVVSNGGVITPSKNTGDIPMSTAPKSSGLGVAQRAKPEVPEGKPKKRARSLTKSEVKRRERELKLKEFLLTIKEYAPTIPVEATRFHLQRGGLGTSTNSQIVTLMSLAADHLAANLVHDSKLHRNLRLQRSGELAKERETLGDPDETTLTEEDLALSFSTRGLVPSGGAAITKASGQWAVDEAAAADRGVR